MGSLGFLTPINFDDYQEAIGNFFKGTAKIINRSRLSCKVFRGESLMNSKKKISGRDKNDVTPSAKSQLAFNVVVLNEVVIKRSSNHLTNLELTTIDGEPITTVIADGLIISTPTGSTAYSMATGASLVSPDLDAILVSFLAPHSLASRSVVLEPGSQLVLSLSLDSRGAVNVVCDGREDKAIELNIGDR